MIQAQVVRLAIKQHYLKEGEIVKQGNKFTIFKKNNTKLVSDISYSLYFTTNEKIQEGDWVSNGYGIWKWDGIKTIHKDPQKVVASTDKSLNLPPIPQQFLEDYVKTNGNIGFAWLEQESYNLWTGKAFDFNSEDYGYRLKLSEKGEVVVVDKKSKNSYTPQFDDQSICFNRTDKEWEEALGEEPVVDKEDSFVTRGRKNIAEYVHMNLDKLLDKDKELEALAEAEYPMTPTMSMANKTTSYHNQKAWKNGYKTAEEKAANDAIAFREWVITDYQMNTCLKKIFDDNLSSKQLYELWQQNKNK